MNPDQRAAEGGKALMWLTALILGGLLFAAGVMVGRSMTPDAPGDRLDPLERIDRREALALANDGQLTYPQVLSGPPIKAPVAPAEGARGAPDAGQAVVAPASRVEPDASGQDQGASAVPGRTFFCLQVASFKERGQAEQMVEGLRARGLDEIQVVESELPAKGQVFRVRLGHFGDREAAARFSAAHSLEGLVIAVEEP
jgi:cell division septation protein DedD